MTYFTLQLQGNFISRIFVGDEKKLQDFQGPGVYFLKDKGGNILYIGEAHNLWVRLREHIDGHDDKTGRCVKYIHHIDIYSVAEKERYPLEKLLILQILPPFNEEFTPEYGNSRAMQAKMDSYLENAPVDYHLNHWTIYEKIAYLYRESIELVVMMGAAEIKWDMDGKLSPFWSWSEWLKSKKTYLKELKNKGLNEEDISNKVWEIIYNINNESGKRSFLDLVATPHTSYITLENSLTRMVINKVSRASRGTGEKDASNGHDSVDLFNSREPITLTDTEKMFDNLVESFITSGEEFHEVEIYHEQSIEILKNTEVWYYLEGTVKSRFIRTALKRANYPRGEFILALITYNEWSNLTNIIEREEYPVDISERDRSPSSRTIEIE